MSRWMALSGALLITVSVSGAAAQVATQVAAPVTRPVPQSVVPPPQFLTAISDGTRTTAGGPGPRYWQNDADYRLRVRVLPETKRVEGTTSIRYRNRSPDTMRGVVLDVLQNYHRPDAVRLEAAEPTKGLEIARVQVNGATASDARSATPRYEVNGTKLLVYLAQPLASGGTVDLSIDYAFTIPESGISGRMGINEDNLIFLAYFYPQMSVYDDVEGWQMDPFLGAAEFYSDFAGYDVTIEAPAGWVVTGTGELTNPQETLAAGVLARLRAAEQSDTVVHVVRSGDFASATQPGRSGVLSWSFRADSVRDVAYSLTRASLWDAARASVGDRNGDGRTDYTRVDAIYRPRARLWSSAARYAQHSIRFLSQYTGLAYPWSHMTAVEGAGIIGGGMEYPMMTLIGDYTAAGDSALYGVVVHEFAHMWLPMTLSLDERRYSWFDEGTTTFNENQAKRDFYPGTDPSAGDRASYISTAKSRQEGEIMRRSDYHYPGPAYVVASYYKPGLVLEALRGVLGEETFNRAYREFMQRWAFKHPYPWDLWNTFENASGRDLDWFWRSWYFETWVLDQAVESVAAEAGGTRIVIADRGEVPMPVLLSIRLASGEQLRREIPVESWLGGGRTASITVPGQVTRVEIDPEKYFPDVDRGNNSWSR
jgi:hypothetical protein